MLLTRYKAFAAGRCTVDLLPHLAVVSQKDFCQSGLGDTDIFLIAYKFDTFDHSKFGYQAGPEGHTPCVTYRKDPPTKESGILTGKVGCV